MAAKRRAETMEENRVKLIGAARKAFAASGFAAASMDDLTAQVGLTRGALYHGFGDKKGLLGAVVAQVDGEMAARARQAGATAADPGKGCWRSAKRISGWHWTRRSDGSSCWTGLPSWATLRDGRARMPA